MSLASSETAISSASPKVVCMFLANFDPKEGYKLVWSRSAEALDLRGIEIKALPSGVHEYEAASIYLAHETNGKVYYGSARFRQINANADGGSDRSLVKMYSLGVLVEPTAGKTWRLQEFSSFGWEHLPVLDTTLSTFMSTGSNDVVSSLYDSLTSVELLEVPRSTPVSYSEHPLNKLPGSLSAVGPLIFPIYKAALLRKRILIFNHSSQGSPELVRHSVARDFASCGALAYIIALVSVVPKNVQFDASNDQNVVFSQPLYTVGLQDMESGFLEHHPGFVATTSDEILKYQKSLYDYAVVMPSTNMATCQVFASSDLRNPVRATYNDYSKFIKVYKRLPQAESTHHASSDDSSSIRTASSMFSALRFGYFGDDKDDKLTREPAWWFNDATAPMSWRQYIWSAFAWFASAGTTDREADRINLNDEPTAEEHSTLKNDLLQLTSIVGQFHKLTKKWFYITEEIISEAIDGTHPGADGEPKIILELTPQDIVDMELDPYSAQDLEFVREFVLTYWSSTVADVEIGLGIHGFFC